ncbi:hypothetical protein CER18_05000 [Bartonella tribocorum]|uniref:Uncharacterized protein n=1 Tax=Bartonella tribocorum TaxID=85701 RepID=A0A2M6US52_9HYPH|nr:hypothetical protein CER18_05000 [Bartonella tribocorum]
MPLLKKTFLSNHQTSWDIAAPMMPDYDDLPHLVLRMEQFLRSPPISKHRKNETHLKREDFPYGQ